MNPQVPYSQRYSNLATTGTPYQTRTAQQRGIKTGGGTNPAGQDKDVTGGGTNPPVQNERVRYFLRAVASPANLGSVSVEVEQTGNGLPNGSANANQQYSNAAVTTPVTENYDPNLFPANTPTYLAGTVLKLTANPASNATFLGWADGVTTRVRRVTLNDHSVYTANFRKLNYNRHLRLTCMASRGRITGTGLTEDTANNVQVVTRVYSADVENGDSITFKAIPLEGYHFVRWAAKAGASALERLNLRSAQLTVRMTDDVTLEALFEPDQTGGGSAGGTNGGNGGTNGGTNGGNGGTHVVGGANEDPSDPEVIGGGDDPYNPGNPDYPYNGGTTTGGTGLMALARKYWWLIAIVAVWWLSSRKESK